MSQKTRRLFFGIFGILFFALSASTHASGVTVGPTYVRLAVSEARPKDSSSVSIKNNNTIDLTYEISIVDVDTESGTLVPLETTSDITKKVFQLKTTSVTLQPNQSVNIVVEASNSADLPPGGHYAALSIKQLSTPTKKTIPINQIISVGLFLVKEDGAVRTIKTVQNNHKNIWFRLPKTEKITIQNNGNVDVVPRGFIALTMSNNTYLKSSFNELSQPVFPAKSVQYTVDYSKNTIRWPGKYTRILSYRYDGAKDQTIEANEFWYVPVWSLLLCLVFLAPLVYVLRRKLFKKSTNNTMPEEGTDVDSKSVSRNGTNSQKYDVLEKIKLKQKKTKPAEIKKPRKRRSKKTAPQKKKKKLVSQL
jgi:hypothetical protein